MSSRSVETKSPSFFWGRLKTGIRSLVNLVPNVYSRCVGQLFSTERTTQILLIVLGLGLIGLAAGLIVQHPRIGNGNAKRTREAAYEVRVPLDLD